MLDIDFCPYNIFIKQLSFKIPWDLSVVLSIWFVCKMRISYMSKDALASLEQAEDEFCGMY